MPTTQPLPPKKEVALALLERSNDKGIYVHLDPRHAAVVVPPWFKKQPQLVLQIGLNMAIPIPDLRLDDEGMSCTLSFNRSPFFCVVPWTSVFAIVGDDARGMVWPDDVPAEIARHASSSPPQGSPQSRPSTNGPAVRAVDGPAKGKGAAGRDGKPESARTSSTNGAGGKKQKKRPPLAAVSEAEPPKGKQRATNAAAAPPLVPVAPASKPALGTPRKKRELPPYLRVVK
ncbi:MAG TPA: ClpXP protease specificity-enhancing factor SspB [Polyangiaceae bacterium]|nr:ClpXP protease specificity-enhancing factor SspB [Polyangiaceae bacterium]